MGMSQMCTGAGDYFRTSNPHSEKLWTLLTWLHFSGPGSAEPSPAPRPVCVTIRSRAPATKGRAKRGAKEAAKFRFQMRLVGGAGRSQRKTAMRNVFCPAQVKTSQVSAYLVPFPQQLSFFPHIIPSSSVCQVQKLKKIHKCIHTCLF